MLKVWIAGANGQIGRALNDVLDPMQIETLNTDLDELDITDTDEVINFGSINCPDVIISTAPVSQIPMSVRRIRTCIPCQRTGSKKLKHRGKKMRGKDRPAFHR